MILSLADGPRQVGHVGTSKMVEMKKLFS